MVKKGRLVDIHIGWEKLDYSTLSTGLHTLFQAAQGSGHDWSHDSHAIAKEKLIDELLDLQMSRCAYCRRGIKKELGRLEIDHILPKEPCGTNLARWVRNEVEHRRCTSGYPTHKFGVQNLILTCKRCNNKKGSYDSVWDRSSPSPASYPSTSICWIHPYTHPYSDHIRLFKGFVYQVANNSPNGEAVIDACKLADLAPIETRARQIWARHAANCLEALLSLAGEDNWTDQQIIEIVQKKYSLKKYPMATAARLRKALEGFRKDNVDLIAAS